MAEDLSSEVEAEIADLAERLTAPAEHECLRCYLIRMITEFGCDGTYRWTIRWRDVRAAQPRGLIRQLQRRGGWCDCEVLINAYPDHQPVTEPLPCAGVARPGSWRPCEVGRLRRAA